jgi:hypothetical protein
MVRALIFVVVCALAAIDAIAADGRYRNASWQEAKKQVSLFNATIRSWVNRIGP